MVTERVELALGRRAAVEPRLGQQPVEDDQPAVRKREPVGPDELRQRARRPDRGDEGDDQHDLLPRGRDVERGVADTRLPEERHREVVEREPDDEDEQRHAGKAGGHVVATSVMPRLWTRTGTGNSARRSAGPSRWFSFAQGFPTRSYARRGGGRREPVHEREPRVHLHREPAVRRRQEDALADAHRLADEGLLPCVARRRARSRRSSGRRRTPRPRREGRTRLPARSGSPGSGPGTARRRGARAR